MVCFQQLEAPDLGSHGANGKRKTNDLKKWNSFAALVQGNLTEISRKRYVFRMSECPIVLMCPKPPRGMSGHDTIIMGSQKCSEGKGQS